MFMTSHDSNRGEGGEVGSKKELIQTAKLIAKESEEVVKMARKVADACTDKRMKRAVLQVVDKLPTISTQLKIIAAVKATRQGGDGKIYLYIWGKPCELWSMEMYINHSNEVFTRIHFESLVIMYHSKNHYFKKFQILKQIKKPVRC